MVLLVAGIYEDRVLLGSDADYLCLVRTIYIIAQGPSTVDRQLQLHSVPSFQETVQGGG